MFAFVRHFGKFNHLFLLELPSDGTVLFWRIQTSLYLEEQTRVLSGVVEDFYYSRTLKDCWTKNDSFSGNCFDKEMTDVRVLLKVKMSLQGSKVGHLIYHSMRLCVHERPGSGLKDWIAPQVNPPVGQTCFVAIHLTTWQGNPPHYIESYRCQDAPTSPRKECRLGRLWTKIVVINDQPPIILLLHTGYDYRKRSFLIWFWNKQTSKS